MKVRTQKTEIVEVTIAQIKVYLLSKNWVFDAGTYRSPNGGRFGLNLTDGEPLLIKELACIENRDTFDVASEIAAIAV